MASFQVKMRKKVFPFRIRSPEDCLLAWRCISEEISFTFPCLLVCSFVEISENNLSLLWRRLIQNPWNIFWMFTKVVFFHLSLLFFTQRDLGSQAVCTGRFFGEYLISAVLFLAVILISLLNCRNFFAFLWSKCFKSLSNSQHVSNTTVKQSAFYLAW